MKSTVTDSSSLRQTGQDLSNISKSLESALRGRETGRLSVLKVFNREAYIGSTLVVATYAHTDLDLPPGFSRRRPTACDDLRWLILPPGTIKVETP